MEVSPIADRTVSVRLSLDNKNFLANLAAAEAAVKKFQDGFGKGSKDAPDPYEPFRTPPKDLPKRSEAAAGAFARGFSRRLDAAFRQLPKAKIDADSSETQRKVADLRASLASLSGKTVGVDVSVASALDELQTLRGELEHLAAESPDIDVRADAGAALAQLQQLQQEVDRLNGADPAIRPDADTAQAQASLGDLRRRLDELSTRRTAGVDLDAGAAHAELGSIQRDLQRLNTSSADVQVRADSAAALAQIRAMQAETSRLDGRTANVRVNADVSGALMGIAAVGAALASLPAVASIGLGVGALGAAFGAAGAGALAFGAVAGPSLGRVNEALKESESAAGGAGGAMKSAGQKAAEAAGSALRLAEAQDRVRDAAYGVRMAQRAVGDALREVKERQDALRQAQEAAGLAGARVSEVAEAGARRVADAERSVQDAHRATQRAVEDLTRARERAQERLEDLALATEGGVLAEERAQMAIRRAKQNLARVTQPGSGASQTDREDAELALREAEFSLKRLKESNADLAAERADADRKGVEGSDEVRAAKSALEAATRREADAERAVADARTQAARDVAAAQRAAAEAARDVARAQREVRDAMRDVGDAQRKVTEAERDQLRAKQRLKLEQLQQKAALEQTGGAAGGAATKMSKLSEAEKELAKDVKKFTDAYEDWQRSLQPDVFPVIRSGMDLLTTGMKIGTPLVRASAGAFGQFLDTVNGELRGEQWGRFFDELTEQAPRAIEGLGNATLNVAGGLAGVMQAFLPYTGDLMTWVEDITQRFETWGQNLGDSTEFQQFIMYARENGPKVAEIVSNVAEAVGKILQAGAGPGAGVLDFLVGLSERLAGMDPAQVEAIAKGVAAIFAAAKLGATLKVGAFVLLAEVLSKMSPGQIEAVALAIAGVVVAVKGYQAANGVVGWFNGLSGAMGKTGKAADTMKGKLSGAFTGGLIVGGVTLAVGALGKLDNSLLGLNPDIDKLAKGISGFVRGAELMPELVDQLKPAQSIFGGMSSSVEGVGDSMSRLTSNGWFDELNTSLMELGDSTGLVTLDAGRKRIENLDLAMANLVSNGNAGDAAKLFDGIKRAAAEQGVPVEKLKDLYPQYTDALTKINEPSVRAADAISKMGKEGGPASSVIAGIARDARDAGEAMDILNMGVQKFFDPAIAAFDAATKLRDSFRDARDAINEAGGKLEYNRRMTSEQSAAVSRARDAFSGYIKDVQSSARAAGELAGKNGDASKAVDASRDAIIKQLPKLSDLAGKNKEARDQVLQLAKAYGISAEDAKKASNGGNDLKEVLAKLKSKSIKITAETGGAKTALQGLIDVARNVAKGIGDVIGNALSNVSTKPPAKPSGKPKKGQAWGGISHADGREYMAMGGIRSAGSSPQAMVAKQPYMISGRSGPDVVFGEAGWEAYIPLDSSKRGRGLQVLGEAASAMGMAVVPQQVGAGSTPAWTSGGALSGASGAMVSVTGIDALKGSLDATSTALTGSLAEATSAVTSTLGEAGSVTSALERMTETLDAQLTKLTSAVESLSGAVAGAGAVAAAAQGKIGSAASAKAKASTGKIGAAVSATAGGKGKIGTAISAAASKSKTPKGVGSAGTSLVTLAGIDGALAAAAKKKVQINMIAGSSSAPVQNPSKVSKPVQVPTKVVTMVAGSNGGGSATQTGADAPGGGGRALIIEHYHEAEGGSARKTAEELNWYDRRS